MKIITVSNTTLFHIAAKELGDAAQWWRIARVNNLTDPVVTAIARLSIPDADSTAGDGLPAAEPTQQFG